MRSTSRRWDCTRRTRGALLAVLYSLRDFGNTVVVVEHDPAMIAGADHVVELGPGGGSEGGELTYSGPPAKATLDSMASSPGGCC